VPWSHDRVQAYYRSFMVVALCTRQGNIIYTRLACPAERNTTRFTDVKVSRRPKRATSVAVIGVLLTKSRLGIRGGVFPRAQAFPLRQAS